MTLKKHSDPEFNLDTSFIMSDTDEVWDMKDLGSVLSKEYQKCRFKNFDQIEL